MQPSIRLLLLLFCSLLIAKGEKSLENYELDQKGFDKVKTIHTNWYVHSMKALIAQLSRNLMPKLSEDIREDFIDCIAKIMDKKDLVESAKCVIHAREAQQVERKRISHKLKIKKRINIKLEITKKQLLKIRRPQMKRMGLVERLKRDFLKKWKNRLHRMRKSRRRVASKRVKRSLRRLVVDSVSKSDSSGYMVKNMDRMPELKSKSKSAVQKIAGLMKAFFSNETKSDPISWLDTYKTIINLKKRMNQKEKEPGARVYNERMYDLVLDTPSKTRGQSTSAMFGSKSKMPDIMRRAFDLMESIEGNGRRKNGKMAENYKFLSPRFAAVMPDKNENRGKLSPSILSFYNDESEDQILSMPKMLDATGMGGKDRDTIIEMVMDLSGAKGIVKEATKILNAVEMPELNTAVSENGRKSMKMVEQIKGSYTRLQKKEMKDKGFALMEPRQMKKLMKEQGIADRKDIFDIDEYAKLTMFQRREMVWDMVRGIAYGISNATRTKRQASVWGPHILTPTVLSPILFTPIFGLNVLGPTVLSPGLFTPLLLNPAVLSPYVFSPTVGIPFILSPYLLSPYVFSPLVMAPFILNPYVLSPNVFNPYVLSPLILSPLVLCPDVVSPMVLGGAILSPGVLSPSVLSKSYLMANVLSPTVLS